MLLSGLRLVTDVSKQEWWGILQEAWVRRIQLHSLWSPNLLNAIWNAGFFNHALHFPMWYVHVLCSLQVKERTLPPRAVPSEQFATDKSRKEDGGEKEGPRLPWSTRWEAVCWWRAVRAWFLTEHSAVLTGWKTGQVITGAAVLNLRVHRSGSKSCLYFWDHVLSKLISRNLS